MIYQIELPAGIPNDVEDKLMDLHDEITREIEEVVQYINAALADATESMLYVKKRDERGYSYESYLQSAENNTSDANDLLEVGSRRSASLPDRAIIEELYQYIELCRAECHRREAISHPIKRFVKKGKEELRL